MIEKKYSYTTSIDLVLTVSIDYRGITINSGDYDLDCADWPTWTQEEFHKCLLDEFEDWLKRPEKKDEKDTVSESIDKLIALLRVCQERIA